MADPPSPQVGDVIYGQPLKGFLCDYIGWIFLFLSCRHKNDYIVHTKYLGKNYSSNSDSWIGKQYFSGKCTPFCLFALLLKEDQNSIFYQEIKNTMRFAKKIWDQKFNQNSIEWFAAKKTLWHKWMELMKLIASMSRNHT